MSWKYFYAFVCCLQIFSFKRLHYWKTCWM